MTSAEERVGRSIEILERTLDTIECRREQLAERSGVVLAASSGLLVLAVQILLALPDGTIVKYSTFLMSLSSVVSSLISVVFTLNLVKQIRRDSHKGRRQHPSAENPFYFGWVARRTERELTQYLSNLDEQEIVGLMARQAVSLSSNLKYRYDNLKRSYRAFTAALVFYVISVVIKALA